MKFFKRFIKSKQQSIITEPRMYVLVRSDLAPGLQMAQACHAASYLSAQDALKLYQHPTTIVLGVPNERELLLYAGSEGFLFREPDLNYEATAYAIFSETTKFSELPLALSN